MTTADRHKKSTEQISKNLGEMKSLHDIAEFRDGAKLAHDLSNDLYAHITQSVPPVSNAEAAKIVADAKKEMLDRLRGNPPATPPASIDKAVDDTLALVAAKTHGTPPQAISNFTTAAHVGNFKTDLMKKEKKEARDQLKSFLADNSAYQDSAWHRVLSAAKTELETKGLDMSSKVETKKQLEEFGNKCNQLKVFNTANCKQVENDLKNLVPPVIPTTVEEFLVASVKLSCENRQFLAKTYENFNNAVKQAYDNGNYDDIDPAIDNFKTNLSRAFDRMLDHLIHAPALATKTPAEQKEYQDALAAVKDAMFKEFLVEMEEKIAQEDAMHMEDLRRNFQAKRLQDKAIGGVGVKALDDKIGATAFRIAAGGAPGAKEDYWIKAAHHEIKDSKDKLMGYANIRADQTATISFNKEAFKDAKTLEQTAKGSMAAFFATKENADLRTVEVTTVPKKMKTAGEIKNNIDAIAAMVKAALELDPPRKLTVSAKVHNELAQACQKLSGNEQKQMQTHLATVNNRINDWNDQAQASIDNTDALRKGPPPAISAKL